MNAESIAYALVPLVAAFVKQAAWSPQRNALIALAVYVAAAIAAIVLGGQAITVETLVEQITTATVVGTVAYKLFWSNLGRSSDGAVSIEQRLEERSSVVG